MAKPKKAKRDSKKNPIEQYAHKGKQRAKNPPVGVVPPQTDKDSGKKTYAYDPHLNPQLVWAGKAERTSFEVPTVSLHVHERIEQYHNICLIQGLDGVRLFIATYC